MSDLGDLERSSSVELEIPSSEDLANSGLKSKVCLLLFRVLQVAACVPFFEFLLIGIVAFFKDKKEVDDLRIPSTTSRKRKALSRSLGLTPPRYVPVPRLARKESGDLP